jgi:hypothetical protein
MEKSFEQVSHSPNRSAWVVVGTQPVARDAKDTLDGTYSGMLNDSGWRDEGQRMVVALAQQK